MKAPLLLALLAVAVPARAGSVAAAAGAIAASSIGPKTEDLSGQFPDAATREQGKTGSCHIFSTVSLIEAALYRAYGLRMPLSEADLFVRKVIKDPAYYDEARQAIGADDDGADAYKFVEGGSPYEDIDFVFQNGVARAKTAPWGTFIQRYRDYKAKRTAQIEPRRQDVVEDAKKYDSWKAQLQDEYESVAKLEQAGITDNLGQVQRANLQRVDANITSGHLQSVADFRAYLSLIAGLSALEAEKLLLGTSPQLAKDRALLKSLTAPMRLKKLSFAVKAPYAEATCAKVGTPQKAGLLVMLDHKVPVSVSMDLAGLKEWNAEGKKSAWHAFTIVGYEKDAKGALTLKSRNSWGGDNPDVPEKHFCRIKKVVAVLTAKE